MKRRRSAAHLSDHLPSGDLRQLIVDHARRLFIRHGYHGLAMRQIAESLGVTKPALYYHFRHKEELFLSILEEYLEVMEQLLLSLLSSPLDCHGRIRSFIEALLSQPDEQRGLIHLVSQEAIHLSAGARQRLLESYEERFLSKLRLILEQGVQRGELRPLEPKLISWVLLGILYPYVSPGATAQPSAQQISELLASIYFHGVAAQR
jgi:AcrR family transcriptional regulator